MDQKLKDCLSGQTGSYILPFFWQHGESQARLLEELEAISRTGVREFCVESRPYEAFGSDQWYTDFGFLLKEAQKRNMRVWLLDDKEFPTGYANGYLRDSSRKDLRKGLIREEHLDVAGPMEGAALLADRAVKEDEERLLAVIAYRRSGEEDRLCGEPLDLTGKVKDGLVYFDLPEGIWRVFFLIRTPHMAREREAPERFQYYIDMLSSASCRSMIEAVYQPHYDRFSEYFGNTFAGFFSDEPCFCNSIGTYNDKLGVAQVLPWRQELLPLLAQACGVSQQQVWGLLPGLWFDSEETTPLIRTAYMDVVTRLYRDSFCRQLGDWCRAHGVLYIGHVIEDMNIHMRLGYGSGHYFRALEGQDMAGIDVVLHQIIPGNREMTNAAPIAGGKADPEFFFYALAKLGASAAHLEPRKKGRAMCEIYGAFGWAEGLPYMKFLTDHMLANGINYYVPHAFSPKYPDLDCPPHFYANGKNPQFPLFGRLMEYMERMCHLLSEGTHVASTAVLYNPEGEWSGGKYQLFQKVAKQLTQHQLDFDFVPADLLTEGICEVKNRRLWINGVSFGALVVSYSQILPMGLLEKLSFLAENGLPVIFADGLPERACSGENLSSLIPLFEQAPLSQLAERLTAMGLEDITLSVPCPALRALHYLRPQGGHLYLFFNEDPAKAVDCQVALSHGGEACFYDPWDNKAYRAQNDSHVLSLSLPPAGLAVVIFGGDWCGLSALPSLPEKMEPLPLFGWKVECREESTDSWQDITNQAPCPGNLSVALPHFSGFIRYTACFSVSESKAFHWLNLGRVGETAQVWLNEQELGAKISFPYVFEAKGLKAGENQLVIEVVNSPAYRERDYFSRFLPLPPSGLLGPITVG